MLFVLISIVFVLLAFGPSLWVKYVLWRYSKTIDEMPGTGAELAEHLIERFELSGVKVEMARPGQNYYSPAEKIVALSPDIYERKSLSAVAVAAHEVGHAIQFCREEPVSKLRTKYMTKAIFIKRIGTYILVSMPFISLVFRSPVILPAMTAIAVATMLASVLMYVAVLPEEYDASFKKALPILEEGYLPKEHYPAIRTILKAAAMTYVAAALSEAFSIWRWFRYLR